MALSPAWWSWQAVLNFSHPKTKKFQGNSNILGSLEAGQGNCLLYVLVQGFSKEAIRKILILNFNLHLGQN